MENEGLTLLSELKPGEIDRIKQMYRGYCDRNPVGDVIDSSEQTPDETVQEILRWIEDTRSPEKHREQRPDPDPLLRTCPVNPFP